MSLTTEESGSYDSIVIAPQCPTNMYWRDEKALDALKDFIDYVIDTCPGADPWRIHMTGFSMGGDGTWKMALNNPETFASIVPVCGGPLASMEPDNPEIRYELCNVNIWAFNSFDDQLVGPAYAKKIMSQIWNWVPEDNSKNFTLFPHGGHSSEKAYSDRDVLIWMLSQSRTYLSDYDIDILEPVSGRTGYFCPECKGVHYSYNDSKDDVIK